jgi:hypothetical protein
MTLSTKTIHLMSFKSLLLNTQKKLINTQAGVKMTKILIWGFIYSKYVVCIQQFNE